MKLFVMLVAFLLVSCNGDKEEEWRLERNKFYQYQRIDPSAAIMQGELVVKIAENTFGHYSDSTAIAFNNLGALYREIGQHDNSHKAYEQEYQILSRICRDVRLADAANRSATYMIQMGILTPEIEARLLQAQAISDSVFSSIVSLPNKADKASTIDATFRTIKIYLNLSLYYIRTGKIKEAEYYASFAAYLCREALRFSDLICFDAYLVLVKFYCASSRNKEAISTCYDMLNLLKSVELGHSVNLRINIFYHILSLAHFQSGQYDSAQYYTNLSAKLLPLMGERQIEAVRTNMYMQGRINTVIRRYGEADSLYRKLGNLLSSRREADYSEPDYSDRANILIDWAINDIALERYSEARQLLAKAKDIYTKSLPPDAPRLMLGLSKADSIITSISTIVN